MFVDLISPKGRSIHLELQTRGQGTYSPTYQPGHLREQAGLGSQRHLLALGRTVSIPILPTTQDEPTNLPFHPPPLLLPHFHTCQACSHSRPSYILFPLPEMLFPQVSSWLSSFISPFKCHFYGEAVPDQPPKLAPCTLAPITPLFCFLHETGHYLRPPRFFILFMSTRRQ